MLSSNIIKTPARFCLSPTAPSAANISGSSAATPVAHQRQQQYHRSHQPHQNASSRARVTLPKTRWQYQLHYARAGSPLRRARTRILDPAVSLSDFRDIPQLRSVLRLCHTPRPRLLFLYVLDGSPIHQHLNTPEPISFLHSLPCRSPPRLDVPLHSILARIGWVKSFRPPTCPGFETPAVASCATFSVVITLRTDFTKCRLTVERNEHSVRPRFDARAVRVVSSSGAVLTPCRKSMALVTLWNRPRLEPPSASCRSCSRAPRHVVDSCISGHLATVCTSAHNDHPTPIPSSQLRHPAAQGPCANMQRQTLLFPQPRPPVPPSTSGYCPGSIAAQLTLPRPPPAQAQLTVAPGGPGRLMPPSDKLFTYTRF
ncbi:hypothetical protein D9619_007481 [Psilocybe cf. subviscida]|uniref:Uncharacterized protein n=1 Tax=Psilocybe cf. subviscida TaxID=2480587 RepID=A0A8H5EWM9_9AGAR|nr:hypothetical protein D9619_007481 [Psilocybe cf. subviscida]